MKNKLSACFSYNFWGAIRPLNEQLIFHWHYSPCSNNSDFETLSNLFCCYVRRTYIILSTERMQQTSYLSVLEIIRNCCPLVEFRTKEYQSTGKIKVEKFKLQNNTPLPLAEIFFYRLRVLKNHVHIFFNEHFAQKKGFLKSHKRRQQAQR